MTEPRDEAGGGATTTSGVAGARVLDIRYTAYADAQPTRAGAIRVLARWSVLRALGVRRSWTAKLWPYALVALAFGPGLAVLAVRGLFVSNFGTDELPVDLLPYGEYLEMINLVVLVFTATVVPVLLCPDRRDRVLSLYLSTAASGLDYLAAKALAAFVLLFAITAPPVLVLFAGNLFFAKDVTGLLAEDADVLWRAPAAAALVSVVYGALGLAISSLTRRRAFAVGGFLVLMVTTPVLAGILAASADAGPSSSWHLLDLAVLPFTLARRVFGEAAGPPTWQLAAVCGALVLGCAALLVVRYRGDDA
ncbi:MAG: ABC transporter permease [Actinomycetes bacterium]